MAAAREVAEGVRVLRAPNPSPMTERGTNSYLVGRGAVAVIDPGPDDPAHLDALMATLGPDERVVAILVTHSHRDHSGLARPLADATGAPVLGYGTSTAGRSAVMARLAETMPLGGGEGVDAGFRPDVTVSDGETVRVAGRELEILWTPGHFGNHIAIGLGEIVFTGDLVMGWASTLISPPDGDLTAFYASCARLRARGARLLLAGHGDPIDDPVARIDWLVGHRQARDRQIRAALAAGDRTPAEITARIYEDVPDALRPAALRNVLAHLIDLVERNDVDVEGEISAEAAFSLR